MRLSLYVPGDTFLYRMPAQVKLLVLVLSGIAVFFVTTPLVLGPTAVGAAALLLSVRAPREQVVRQLLGPLIMLAVVVAAAALLQSVSTAATVGLRLVTLLLLAMSVTFTTQTSAMLDVVERILRPLDRTRLVNSSSVALAVSLALRFIPEVFHRFQQIQEAQAARGLLGNPIALVVPLVIRVLRSAEDIAAAIDARCYPPPAVPSCFAEDKDSR
jgi:biotin transport system permease protein